MAAEFLDSLNFKKRCRAAGVGLWQCPHFLFIVMGIVNIAAIIAANAVARRYTEPEIAALVVLLTSAALFIIGYIIIRSFENIVEVSRMKSDFIGIVSHELRSPLSAIKWSIDLIKREGNNLSSSFVETIEEQNQKMLRLVNTLLDVIKIEDNKITLQPETFSINDLTLKVIERLNAFARASNAEILFKAFGPGPAVWADPKKIESVIENLLDNAIRYSSGKSKITITIEEKTGKIIWKICDQGAGIPKKDVKKIFSKFFRSQNSFRYRGGGAGMGLFLARAFIRASGGEINFQTEEGKGSVFWFTLPRAAKN
jgi:signal transduction histidine kinase